MKRLPRTVLALGAVSLFTDLSSEMIYPLLGGFMATLGAGGAWVGAIEGTADTVAALLKLASGRWSDAARRRKPLVVLGYALASVARPLVALAAAPWHVLVVRVTDRVGKGIRSSPRDAMIAHAVAPERRGEAYGFHRAMDHAGAMLGPLVAMALLAAGLGVRWIFVLAAVPAAAAMLALYLGVKEDPDTGAGAGAGAGSGAGAGAGARLPAELWEYLALVGLFTLASSSDLFLLLRAAELGIVTWQIPLLWAGLHAVKSGLSTPLGKLSDVIPRRRMIVLGWALYALCYAGFAIATESWQAYLLFALYGTHFALVEGAEKALVADLAPPDLRGTAFGAFHFVVGMCALPASIGFGLVWDQVSHAAAFLCGAALAGLAALLALAFFRHRG